MDPDAELAADIALIEGSGLFDHDGYRRAEAAEFASHDAPWQARERERHELAQADPVRHYCTVGWPDLRNPSLDFDGWWYTTTYLDPARDGVNPFAHYLREGRGLGHRTLPPTVADGEAKPAPDGVRRVCLFAGFDKDGLIDEHVVDLVRELATYADVYYLTDGELRPGELDKLAPYTRGRWTARHGGYDFGSWSMLAQDLVGWDAIDAYDELLLVNDSSYLVRPLAEVFARMDAKACDWWGMQLTAEQFPGLSTDPDDDGLPLDEVREALPRRVFDYATYPHVGSYFLVFRRPVTQDPGFRRLLGSVTPQPVKRRIVLKYETGLTRYLVAAGFRLETVADRLYPFHPVYSARAFELIGDGFPFLKRQLLAVNPFGTPGIDRWKQRLLEQAPDARVDVIERHLVRTGDARALARSFGTAPTRPFPEQDKKTPKQRDHWAFVADPATGQLLGDVRAVFEEVRHEPSLRKVVLSRQHPLALDGTNVLSALDWTDEGREALARCGYVFVSSGPRIDLSVRAVPRGRTFVHLSPESVESGAPRHDLLLRDEDRLPEDLHAHLVVLRTMLAGRRLVLQIGGEPTELPRDGKVLGVRDLPGSWRLANAYAGTDALVLDADTFPSIEMLLREAHELVSTSEAARLDFAVARSPLDDDQQAARLVERLRSART